MERYFKTILVPIDFSESSKYVISQAINFAKTLNTSITLYHVIEENNMITKFLFDGSTEKLIASVKEKLEELANEYRKKSKITIETLVDKGKVYTKISEFADQTMASLVLIGRNSSDSSDEKRYIGANASRIVRETKCPVISYLSAGEDKKDCKKIVLPLDLTKQTKQKVNKAIEIAKIFGATIKVVSALITSDQDIYEQLKSQIEEVKRYIEERSIYCTSEIVRDEFGTKSSLSQMIVDYAELADADLIMIMTQQEKNWVKFFVGSAAQEIMRNSTIPVMSIIPDVFVVD
ncbi:MAG: universal stress protein [Bacteroidota bacterium]